MSKLKEFEVKNKEAKIKKEAEDVISISVPAEIGKEIRENALKYNMKIKEYMINVHKFYMQYLKENKK
ncbi:MULTISPECIES: hypothetical protein [Brachyspira]|uniref:hypothetical protein n=1 Tax=Brachyspira TaxID=29521 RepID=UPI00036E6922|nr:hypothetical protein [Brachyspira innocens]